MTVTPVTRALRYVNLAANAVIHIMNFFYAQSNDCFVYINLNKDIIYFIFVCLHYPIREGIILSMYSFRASQ